METPLDLIIDAAEARKRTDALVAALPSNLRAIDIIKNLMRQVLDAVSDRRCEASVSVLDREMGNPAGTGVSDSDRVRFRLEIEATTAAVKEWLASRGYAVDIRKDWLDRSQEHVTEFTVSW